jgi:alkylated DNA repair protein alkB family protein 8
VHALYDAIAEHFSHTRHAPWPRVAAFLAALPPGSTVLDVGCGNGKYMRTRADVAVVGCDRSAPLAAIAAGRGHNALVADALALPFRTGCADAVLCVAVLHHLSSAHRRLAALAEALRVAAPRGGTLFLQAWAAEQGAGSRRDFSGAPGGDALVPWVLARRFVCGDDEAVRAAGGTLADDAAGRGGGGGGGSAGAVVFQRFVHAFSRGELEGLLAAAAASRGWVLHDERPPGERAEVPLPAGGGSGDGGGGGDAPPQPVSGEPTGCLRLLSSWWDRDNWCVVAARA